MCLGTHIYIHNMPTVLANMELNVYWIVVAATDGIIQISGCDYDII